MIFCLLSDFSDFFFLSCFLLVTVAIFKHTETAAPTDVAPLVVAVSSDRGLCGGIHSSISKNVKRFVAKNNTAPIVILGVKAKNQISRDYRKNVVLHFEQVAKNVPVWVESAMIADEIISAGKGDALTSLFYNKFKSVIAFETQQLPVFSTEIIAASRMFDKFLNIFFLFLTD